MGFSTLGILAWLSLDVQRNIFRIIKIIILKNMKKRCKNIQI
jgi:hypothetical protein